MYKSFSYLIICAQYKFSMIAIIIWYYIKEIWLFWFEFHAIIPNSLY